MSQCSTRSQEYDQWLDFYVWREIGGEVVRKEVSLCAKIYDGEIEFWFNTKGCEELTPAEWEKAEEKILAEIRS